MTVKAAGGQELETSTAGAPRHADESQPETIGRRATAWAKGRPGLWLQLVLLLQVIVLWARPALGSFTTLRLTNPGDSESFAFYLSWNVHAITHWTDPFFTPYLYAPYGQDLGNAISIPTVSILVAPVTAIWGDTAGYNVAMLAAIFLAALATYFLAHELFGSRLGAFAAGSLVVVSPYFAGHALGHLNLMWIAGLPFLAYILARHVKGRLRARFVVLWTAVTVLFTFGASTELIVTESLFAAVALVIALLFAQAEVRRKLVRSLVWLAAGFAVGVLAATPIILAALHAGIPATPTNAPADFPTDLTNLFAPTQTAWIGDSFFYGLWPSWLGNEAENTAYIPITLWAIILLAIASRLNRRTLGLLAFAVVALVCSFGPYLTIAGTQTVPLPWKLATHFPGVDHALPVRFSGFVFIALAVVVAGLFANPSVKRWVIVPLTALTWILLIPNTPTYFTADTSLPAFVTDGALEAQVEQGENVLVLPAGQWGHGMTWVDASDFHFKLITGNGGGAITPDALKDPTAWALWAQDLSYDWKNNLPAYLDQVNSNMVLVDARDQEWVDVMNQVFPGQGVLIDGVWVFDRS